MNAFFRFQDWLFKLVGWNIPSGAVISSTKTETVEVPGTIPYGLQFRFHGAEGRVFHYDPETRKWK